MTTIRLLPIFLLIFSSLVNGQQVNPNKLPPCPSADLSKSTDIERITRWTNCWGRYRIEFHKDYKGDVLQGEWKNGNLHGQAIYTHANGNRYQGEYRDGKKNGKGTYTVADGARYEGEFREDKANGQGTYTHANGDRYQGEFRDNKFHGQGLYTKANGTRQEGIFENGEFVRNAKINISPNRQQVDQKHQQDLVKETTEDEKAAKSATRFFEEVIKQVFSEGSSSEEIDSKGWCIEVEGQVLGRQICTPSNVRFHSASNGRVKFVWNYECTTGTSGSSALDYGECGRNTRNYGVSTSSKYRCMPC